MSKTGKKAKAVSRSRVDPIILEPNEYLQFENAWLKVRLARSGLRESELAVEFMKANLMRKYKLEGDWRIDPERRCLVPDSGSS